MRFLKTCTALLLAATTATAQEQPNTILVLDGSGSMWGQIDGVAKITIAQDVVGDLLGTIPSDQGLGLTVYGHRERGDCTDIETIVAPAPGTAGIIREAVSGIKPLGKTPMTDAVIAAAQALRYTEDKATVILVSDGVETCNPDPCAAARLLEEAGIDFTAHVVGFDVGSDPEALAQMQCIASETGGQFLTADDASQLSEALTTVAAAPEPTPPTEMTFEARLDTADAPFLDGPVIWSINPQPENVSENVEGNNLTYHLEQGAYDVSATWVISEIEMSQSFVVTDESATITLLFPAPVMEATVTAPTTAPLGSTISVEWDGPNGTDDYVGIGSLDATGAEQWHNFAYTADGNPATLLVPPTEGPHLIHYFSGADRTSIGKVEIMVTPVDIQLNAPTEANVGTEISVEWVGPDYTDDYIGIGKVDSTSANQWENYAYTKAGSPAALTLPTEPGDYLITYFIGQDRTKTVQIPITLTEVLANLIAPTEAVVGTTIVVGWDGPDYQNDYVGIGKAGLENANAWVNYFYTKNGNPGELVMPTEPGDYEIQYFLGQDRSSLVSVPITLTEVSATVSAPTEGIVGSTVMVEWAGPDYPNDYIGIGKAGLTNANAWENYFYTNKGNPAVLVLPTEPGEYEIQYFLGQDRSSLVSVPITLSEVVAGVTAPSEAIAGSTIMVEWTGPDYENDYIGIGEAGLTNANAWEQSTYTREGSPLVLAVPSEPGEYEIQYFLSQDRTSIASTPITVSAVEATISAPAEVIAGASFTVEWTGPDYDNDYIGIGESGTSGANLWANSTYTNEGSPLVLTAPTTVGPHVVSYFMSQDRTMVTQVEINVLPVKAQLIAPQSALAGSELIVGWDGPNYPRDYIAVGKVDAQGASQWEEYSYTDSGNPVTIELPDDPGDYFITYFLGQDRTKIEQIALTIE